MVLMLPPIPQPQYKNVLERKYQSIFFVFYYFCWIQSRVKIWIFVLNNILLNSVVPFFQIFKITGFKTNDTYYMVDHACN